MSVTITRRRAVKLGEQAIEKAIGYAPSVFEDESPEVIAFRQVIAQSPAFARGCCWYGDVCCPMYQTVFRDLDEDRTWYLAVSWDEVTREAGLDAFVIHVNPLTS